MRIINLNESQFSRLFEGVTDGNFGSSSMPEFQDQSKVGLQPKMMKQDGSLTDAKPITTDKFASQQTTQQWSGLNGRKTSNGV